MKLSLSVCREAKRLRLMNELIFVLASQTYAHKNLKAISNCELFQSTTFQPLMDSVTIEFLLNPIFLRGFSGLLHLILFLILFVSFVSKIFRVRDDEGSKHRSRKNTRFLCKKQILVYCLGVSLFNLVLCLLCYFYWRGNDWPDDKIVTFFYFSVCCSYLVVDVFLYHNHVSSEIPYLASDVVSAFTGLFFCCLGFSRLENQHADLKEPLLKSDSSSFGRSTGGESVTPYANAGLFSVLTFSWLNSLIDSGHEKTLDLEDVPQLHGLDSVVEAFPIFRNKLQSDRGSNGRVTPSRLAKALFLSAWKQILGTALLAIIYTAAAYVGPYLIDALVQCLDGRGEFKNQGYVLVLTFSVAKLLEGISERQLDFRLMQIGMRFRAVTATMIYNKSLTLSYQSKQGQTSGEIINVMTVDVERIENFCFSMHNPWLVPLQIGLALWILYYNLRLASVAAVIVTILVMLLNYPLGKLLEKFQVRLMESKDNRMKATTEILKNMRILKLQGWEMKFLSKIFELRKIEAGWLRKCLYTDEVLMDFVYRNAPVLAAVATFGTSVFIGIPLEAGKILSALATFRILQRPLYILPNAITNLIQTKVSIDRIASFLSLDDLQPNVLENLLVGSSDTAIEIVGANFSWDLSSPTTILKDVNLKVIDGMRVAICGSVGSGKSSLLSCILGEMPKVSGTLKLCGTKAYVTQLPWIQSVTIEENILFGKEMNRERYERVLEACSLKKDLEIFSLGDQTIIGERGINLSGGQKQRIQIARALYQDADIYLLDDPFSAVDAHTGSHLFKEVLLGLLSSKTVIFVTHQVEFLPAADLILVMKDGRIIQAGKYNDILSSGSDFMELVGAHKEALSALDSKQADLVSENGSVRKDNDGESRTHGILQIDVDKGSQDDKADESDGSKPQLIQEEEREKGSIKFPTYWKYMTMAYGGALVPLVLLAQILFLILQIAGNYWMAWATPLSKDVKPGIRGSTLIIVYASLGIGTSFCILARETALTTAGYKTATLLFNKMHMCIFRAPMSFFDATPSGRILSRASTDQNVVELQFWYTLAALSFSSIQLLGIIAVMSQVAWQVFIVFIPMTTACIWYQRYYAASARELSRLIGVCRTPVIQHFAETISGVTTIRSFDQQSRFQETYMKLNDAYSRPHFHKASAMEWLSFRLDMLTCITFAFSLVYLFAFAEGIDPSIAGLSVTYGLNLSMFQKFVIYNLCNCETRIVSVERILQYMTIPSEPPLVVEASRPDHSWPSNGEVDILNLQVRYAPHLPLVLRGLTCTFSGGKKTGIVGRTGSGKSTLIQTLFRIVETTAGRIMIDGTDISLIGLHDLRSRLSIIPQDPTMFEGTVRTNLDPLEEYTDDQIWEALDKCQLGDEVRRKETKLDSIVTENGENWSMGQRQLICLGRVLLKKSKVLVLDEATASVDTTTDNLIQQTLRQHFSDCTVITIAHRITSVLDSDMVLLLSQGRIEEYDSPARLLENRSSSFAQLVAEYTARSNSNFQESSGLN